METLRPITVIEPFAGASESPYMQEYGQYLSPFQDAVGEDGDSITITVEPFWKRRDVRIAWAVLSTASMAASAFHGYRRNQTVGWALWWGLMGGMFPVITPTIALAQGFGKEK